jgi:hypothetical protein
MFQLLNYSIDNKIIGYYPQLKYELYEGRSFSPLFDVMDQEPLNLLANELPLSGPIMWPRAKWTDLITHSHFLISEKLYQILLNSNIQYYRVRKVLISRKSEERLYYMLAFDRDLDVENANILDFQKSEFFVFERGNPLARIFLEDSAEYLNVIKYFKKTFSINDYKTIGIIKLVPQENNYKDLFFLRNLKIGYPIISDRLVEVFKSSGVTGMNFKPLDELTTPGGGQYRLKEEKVFDIDSIRGFFV